MDNIKKSNSNNMSLHQTISIDVSKYGATKYLGFVVITVISKQPNLA